MKINITIPPVSILVKDSRMRISAVLVMVWLLALLVHFAISFVTFPLLTIFLTIVFDYVCVKLKKKPTRFPYASIVTGLILGLTLYPFERPLAVLVGPLVAVLSKQFICIRGRHVFNPAGFGIIVTNLLLGSSVAWWAAAANQWSVVIIGLGAGFVLWRFNRLWLPMTFLLAYALYLGFIGGIGRIAPLVLDGTTFQFAFIMLSEPMTSPASGWWRYTWGPLIVLLVVIQQKFISISDPLLVALLGANVLGRLMRR